MSLKFVRIGDICEVVSGATPKTKQAEFWDGDIPWATPKDLSENDSKYLNDTPRKITDTGLKSCSAKLLPVGSVLFSSRAPIGLLAINTQPVCTNQGFKSLVPREGVVTADYLYWWLKANRPEIEKRGRGATFKEISKKIVQDIEIPLPDIGEQKRIAAILDAADALRAKRRETLAQLDTMLQSTFLEMFGDPVTNPKGWKKTPMGQLMRIRRGGSPRPIKRYLGGTINWVKIGDATRSDDDLYIRSCAEKISEDGLSKTTLLQPGSLIFANSGVSLGFARILSVQGAIHDGWLAFEGFDEDLLDRIFFLKALNGITEHFRKTAPSGTQPNLNTSIMKAFQIILPPIGDQRHFAAIVQSVEQQKSRLRAHLDELDALFGSLQTRAFAGEL